ncbi:MAG: hypothetical protein N2489_03625 [Clostridia bacterium]|nr:hypothetical protein [Clostridia bacterium]
MEDCKQLKHDVDKCFHNLKEQIDHSFILMKEQPEKKEEVVNTWKKHIIQFITYTFNASEKYDNRDVFKAITKALMFGK